MSVVSISISESKRLIALEQAIERGQQTFVEVGVALAEIRDSRLYRSDFGTFEDYCREKWGWTKQHAYRLIECAPIAKSNPQVTSVNQARELAKVEPSKRVEVLESVAASGPVTAKSIKEAAQEFYEPGVNSVKTPTKEAEAADEESDSFFQLKRWWKKATKKDRKKFLRWVKSTGE